MKQEKNQLRVGIYTLGCKVNQYESDGILDELENDGFKIVDFNDLADIYIINTCSVTNKAERKSRQIISRARKNNPNAIVIVAGCYVQSEKENIKEKLNIDIIVGNNRKKDIVRLIKDYMEDNIIKDNLIDINNTDEFENMKLLVPHGHTRAYVKIQDGCNNFCSYCIIPYTRGRARSRDKEKILDEIINLSDNNIKEIVLTGINLSSFENENDYFLIDIINDISKISGIKRIRLGSLEPRIITDEFLESLRTNEKFCPHFHLSLQSGCNETLKRMNRKYTIEDYFEKCCKIRKYFSDPAITTDIIVGFPGETKEEFEITKNNLIKLKLYEMHIFKYSIRSHTLAAKMENKISEEEKEKRSRELIEIAEKNKIEFEKLFLNKEVEILVEKVFKQEDEIFISVHTKRYILVKSRVDSYSYGEKHVNKIKRLQFTKKIDTMTKV